MIALSLGLLLDLLLGEPRRWHPLVGFGAVANVVEGYGNRPGDPARRQVSRGAVAWMMLVLPLPLALWWALQHLTHGAALAVETLVLYLSLGNRSLAEHARAVMRPLGAGDMDRARGAVAMLVSRDSAQLDAGGVTRAAVESVLENGSDAVIAPLFWQLVAGPPGVLVHRLSNTLDASWGYRSDRYRDFGRVAARADDVLNWVPARLCALLYALAGQVRPALRCWRRQARRAASPNGGPVMAAGAGALTIWLGGPTPYGGRLQPRPILGCGREARPPDIERALRLLWRATGLFVVLGFALGMLWGYPWA